MSRYASLLRGINVGRAKRLAMADLRGLVEELGFTNVRTLLNSGNVVFDAPGGDGAHIASRLEQAIADHAGFRSNVIVVSRGEMTTIAGENALATRADNHSRLLVVFVRDGARLQHLAPLATRDWSPEALHVGSKAAYIWSPNGVLASEVFEASGRVLGDQVTTRNWATLLKLCALMDVPVP